MLVATVRRHPRLTAFAGLLIAGALAAPIVAYVIVPTFVKSTLVEELPAATAGAATTTTGGTAPTAGASALETLAKGELQKISLADYGSGIVRIVRVDGRRFLRFEDVDIAGAPDMYVYLSDRTDGKPGTFVDLGKLKATNGSFNYEIPATVDLSAVRSLVVWCRQFTVTVTFAVLAKP